MKQYKAAATAGTCLGAVLLVAVAATTATAQDLQGRVTLRPLTPEELKHPTLVGKQGASGLSTVGIGQPAYLEALVNSAVDPASIIGVSWELTAKPVGSAAALADSPLGAQIPTYEIRERPTTQVVGRQMLRPDLPGQYTVTATIATTSSGSPIFTQTITAGKYLGSESCGMCHGGGPVAPDKYEGWLATKHASMLTRHIDGQDGGYRNASCITCHTVGNDANTNAVNGGFDDIAKQVGWTFPAVLTNGNWSAMPHSLQVVGNIGCENCHGAGSEHALAAILSGPEAAKQRISKTLSVGDCAQCHDSMTHHFRPAQWVNSGHAVSPEETSASCGRCHTAQGFANFAAGKPAVETPYEVITCAACHDPHDVTNQHQLRTLKDVKLMDTSKPGGATTVTEGGNGKLCMQCHISRRDAVSYAGTYRSHYGPHYGPQTDMFVGANAITYGKEIPSSAHRAVVEDACVTCHMQEMSDHADPAHTHAGGHTFAMKWDSGTKVVEMTEACVQCHGEVEGFDFKRQDYDGNGIVEGVQTEVKGLLSKLALMLPPVGVPKPNHSDHNLSIDGTWTRPQLMAAYNYLFVVSDGSYGVHNLSYAVGLLKASIGDLMDDDNNDGIADTWQEQYFGSATNPNAAPNATPANDGIPNWLKYSLGLNPTVAGVSFPGGVVWADGKALGGSVPTNSVQIYTAAEVTFNTEAGKSYQLQAISSLGTGWSNVGTPIAGTGQAISYVTPTRSNVQQYYRVVTLQ